MLRPSLFPSVLQLPCVRWHLYVRLLHCSESGGSIAVFLRVLKRESIKFSPNIFSNFVFVPAQREQSILFNSVSPSVCYDFNTGSVRDIYPKREFITAFVNPQSFTIHKQSCYGHKNNVNTNMYRPSPRRGKSAQSSSRNNQITILHIYIYFFFFSDAFSSKFNQTLNENCTFYRGQVNNHDDTMFLCVV